MRLHRPYIPLEVRCRVALRQLEFNASVIEHWRRADKVGPRSIKEALRRLLILLADDLGCASGELHLDHDPPLAARQRRGEGKRTVYSPDANDPAHLVYREKRAHHIKTNVRGDGAQYPDRVLITRERRRRRKKADHKRRWPKRKLRSASRWPPRGLRKLKGRQR